MDAYWFLTYLILAGLVVVQSLLLALQTWEHRRYSRSCMRRLDRHQPTGRVALFAPCKGVDLGLAANLRSLFEQDYDDYEITFIVESTEDPAYEAIGRAMAEHPWVSSRVVVAGHATDSGQKVHNLLVATQHVPDRVKYLAFVDSDARPRPEWLRMLIAQLDQPGLGAVTGYRWFTPERASIANALVYSMNCDVLSLLTRSSHYLIWGGSWAIRREVFEALGLRDAWKGTLSDDLVASRLMRRARLQVRFEPACVVASPLDESLAESDVVHPPPISHRPAVHVRLVAVLLRGGHVLESDLAGEPWRAGMEFLDRLAVALDSRCRRRRALPGDGLSRLAASRPGENLLPPVGKGFAADPAVRHLGQPAGRVRPLDRRGQRGRRAPHPLARHLLSRPAGRTSADHLAQACGGRQLRRGKTAPRRRISAARRRAGIASRRGIALPRHGVKRRWRRKRCPSCAALALRR